MTNSNLTRPLSLTREKSLPFLPLAAVGNDPGTGVAPPSSNNSQRALKRTSIAPPTHPQRALQCAPNTPPTPPPTRPQARPKRALKRVLKNAPNASPTRPQSRSQHFLKRLLPPTRRQAHFKCAPNAPSNASHSRPQAHPNVSQTLRPPNVSSNFPNADSQDRRYVFSFLRFFRV